MARWIGPSPEHDHIRALLAAAEVWRDRCLLEAGSVFSDASLWTPETMAELTGRLEVDPLDGQKASFYEKLEVQMKGAPPEVVQLATEVIWFALLFVWNEDMRPQTKRNRITLLWGWSGADPIDESIYLSDQTLGGAGRVGRGYLPRLSMESRFLMRVVGQWRALPADRRAELMGAESPWHFAEWLDAIEGAEQRQIRHMLLFFLFPDHFERSVTHSHKAQIVKTFRDRAPAIPAQVRTNGELDRALYVIRSALEHEHGTQEIDFYFPPLEPLWRGSSTPPPAPAPAPAEPDDTEAEPAVRHGPLNLILYGPPGTGKTFATIRRSVELCDGQANLSDEEIRNRFRALVGDANAQGRIEFTTFHESYSYEEFVEGLRPVTGESDRGTGAGFRLEPTDGVLMRIARRARAHRSEPYVLIIDEINRANVSKVLGELITVLEEDKRKDAPNEISVTLPYSSHRFTMPSNLFVLGTMNTADRSIALLDTALRRRFEFEEISPDPALLPERIDGMGVSPREVLRVMNERLEWLRDRDHRIGHAWLMNARTREDFDHAMRHKVIPLIAEYFHNEWEKVRAVLGNTGDFVARHPLDEPPGIEGMGEDRYRWSVREDFAPDAYEHLVWSGAAPAQVDRNEA